MPCGVCWLPSQLSEYCDTGLDVHGRQWPHTFPSQDGSGITICASVCRHARITFTFSLTHLRAYRPQRPRVWLKNFPVADQACTWAGDHNLTWIPRNDDAGGSHFWAHSRSHGCAPVSLICSYGRLAGCLWSVHSLCACSGVLFDGQLPPPGEHLSCNHTLPTLYSGI